MKFTRTKSSIKKLLTPKEANDLFFETYEHIQIWDKQSRSIRRCFYHLICGDAFIGLEYKSEIVLFKELCNLSALHRSTLYDYKNAALMEVELGLEHGKISVNALLELKTNTTEESRKEIWKRVEHICYFDEKNPTPTKAIITEAKKYHHYHSHEGKAERNAYLENLDDGLSIRCDDKSRQMTAEKALRRIKQFTSKELKMLSKRIFPMGRISKYAYRILHESTEEELEKFKEGLQAYCAINDKKAYEYTDEELVEFEKEFQAYGPVYEE